MNSKQKLVRIGVPIILCAIAAVVVGKVWFKAHKIKRNDDKITQWRTQTWPEERKQAQEKIKARQAVNETVNPVLINLKSFVTAKLTDAPICWKGKKANNLAELPEGKGIYGGVPFEVEGSIQLMGNWLRHYQKVYPTKAEGIPINKRCTKIHILHGAGNVEEKIFGTAIAKLEVHFEDGSTKEINLVAGEHVFDWWSPLFTTGVNPRLKQMAPGTELAWTGSNEYIKKWAPENSLNIYKSTFESPMPNLTITSLDYVSNVTDACPFLVGLTVE